MNKHNAKDYLPLVQALAEGKVIQVDPTANSAWRDYSEKEDGPLDAWHFSRIRIKPEPRKAWVWWPTRDDTNYDGPTTTTSRERAERWMDKFGGHITEVTE